jgi:hypothetical protein
VRRPRFAVRVVGDDDRWLYWSGAIGIQTGPKGTRHKGTRREAKELVRGAKKWLWKTRDRDGVVNLTGLCKGDRFVIVRLTPRGQFPHADAVPVVPEEKGRALREFLAGLVRSEWRDPTETNAFWPHLARWIEGGPEATSVVFTVDLNRLYLALMPTERKSGESTLRPVLAELAAKIRSAGAGS